MLQTAEQTRKTTDILMLVQCCDGATTLIFLLYQLISLTTMVSTNTEYLPHTSVLFTHFQTGVVQ